MTTHRITPDCRPSFPCWLWDSENQWTHHASPVPSKHLARLGYFYLYFSALPLDQEPEAVEEAQAASNWPNDNGRTVDAAGNALESPLVLPAVTALAKKAAREIEFACGKAVSDPSRGKTADIILRYLTAALAQSEAHKAGLIQDVNNLQRGMEGLKAALAKGEGERDAHIAIALSCGQSTVAGLKESLLREMHRNNQKDLPAGFDSWSAYHEDIVKLRKDLAALRADKERLEQKFEALLESQTTMMPEPKNQTLWRYLENARVAGVTHHALAAHVQPDGGFHFYIHPASVSGDTQDYLIWPDPFDWSDLLVNRLDSPKPDVHKFLRWLDSRADSARNAAVNEGKL